MSDNNFWTFLMSTKPPLQFREHPADSLERLASALHRPYRLKTERSSFRLAYCLWAMAE